jgi:hypothetical protein
VVSGHHLLVIFNLKPLKLDIRTLLGKINLQTAKPMIDVSKE